MPTASIADHRTQDITALRAALLTWAAETSLRTATTADQRGRMQRGLAIALRDGVRRTIDTTDGVSWEVSSDDGTGGTYTIHGKHCPCKSAEFSTLPCKHRHAIVFLCEASRTARGALYVHLNGLSAIAWKASPDSLGVVYVDETAPEKLGTWAMLSADEVPDDFLVFGKVFPD